MTGYRRILLAALPPLLWASAAMAQASFDCAKASTASEKAICADPTLAATDKAMGQAYDALEKTLKPDQQKGLRADQNGWVANRDGGCFQMTGDTLTQCLLTATNQRKNFLAGVGDNGPAGAPPLLPAFFDESKKNLYDIAVAYPNFAPPVAPKFNAAAKDLVLGGNVLDDYRTDKPGPVPGATNFYDVGYDVTFLDPHLAAVTVQFFGFAGGAHPNNWRSALLWNLTQDKPVALGDFFADPEKAVPAVSALCKAIAEKEDWGLLDNPDFDTVVKDPKSWAVGKDGATILFDPYSVAPYAAGPHDCRLTWDALKDLLKPGGMLPPQ